MATKSIGYSDSSFTDDGESLEIYIDITAVAPNGVEIEESVLEYAAAMAADKIFDEGFNNDY